MRETQTGYVSKKELRLKDVKRLSDRSHRSDILNNIEKAVYPSLEYIHETVDIWVSTTLNNIIYQINEKIIQHLPKTVPMNYWKAMVRFTNEDDIIAAIMQLMFIHSRVWEGSAGQKMFSLFDQFDEHGNSVNPKIQGLAASFERYSRTLESYKCDYEDLYDNDITELNLYVEALDSISYDGMYKVRDSKSNPYNSSFTKIWDRKANVYEAFTILSDYIEYYRSKNKRR